MVFYSSIVFGTTYTAATCSQADVQAAINSASDGDTVIIPAGTCVWNTTVSWTNKAIILQGNGIGNTIINDETGDAADEVLLLINGTDNEKWRVTGFSFISGTTSTQLIKVKSSSHQWRIDNCRFEIESTGIRIIPSSNQSYGLIDHCQFYSDGGGNGVAIFGSGASDWNTDLSLGSADAVYIEDCSFEWDNNAIDSAIDAYNGARFVFRYNNCSGIDLHWHGMDSGGYHAPVSFEVYSNVFDQVTKGNPIARPIYIRGGSGVIYENYFYGDYSTDAFVFTYNCMCKDETICSDPWPECDWSSGTTDASGIFYCSEQPARSPDADSDGFYDLEPLYEWNNIWCLATDCSGGQQNINYSVSDIAGCTNGDGLNLTDIYVENRDYYNDTQRPGYIAYEYPHPLRGERVSMHGCSVTGGSFP